MHSTSALLTKADLMALQPNNNEEEQPMMGMNKIVYNMKI